MKQLLSILAIAILSVSIYSCSDSSASKPAVVKETNYDEGLLKLGFKNVPSVENNNDRTMEGFYLMKTGLHFIGDDSLTNFCARNGLMASEAENFKGEIPESKKKEIVENYRRLKSVKHYFFDLFWGQYYQVGTSKHDSFDPLNRSGIQMVAPPELFTLNAFIKKDPMAIVKVDSGWLILASW